MQHRPYTIAVVDRHRRQYGLSYVEVLLAVLLLAVCLVPALETVRDSLAAPAMTSDPSTTLFCLHSRLEEIAVERYADLLNAAEKAGTIDVAAVDYAKPADAICGKRDVFLERIDPDRAGQFFSPDLGIVVPDQLDTGLLHAIVRMEGDDRELSVFVLR